MMDRAMRTKKFWLDRDEFLEVVFKNTERPSEVGCSQILECTKKGPCSDGMQYQGFLEYCPSLSLKSKKIEIKFQKTEMPYDNLVVWEVVGLSKRIYTKCLALSGKIESVFLS